jgi:hypothetical protein
VYPLYFSFLNVPFGRIVLALATRHTIVYNLQALWCSGPLIAQQLSRPPPCRHRDASTDTTTTVDGLHHPLLGSSILPIRPLTPRQEITGANEGQDGPDHPQPAVLQAAPASSLAHFGLALLRRRWCESSSRPATATTSSEQRCGRVVVDCELRSLPFAHRFMTSFGVFTNGKNAVPVTENRD